VQGGADPGLDSGIVQQEVPRGLEGEAQVGSPAGSEAVVVPLGVVVQHVVDEVDADQRAEDSGSAGQGGSDLAADGAAGRGRIVPDGDRVTVDDPLHQVKHLRPRRDLGHGADPPLDGLEH
jgi:hypothetical protein